MTAPRSFLDSLVYSVGRAAIDGTIQAIGDSRTANSGVGDIRIANNAYDTYDPRGILTWLIALSGGALKAVNGGYPRLQGENFQAIKKAFVVKGGQNYSPSTVLQVSTTSGGTGGALTPTIVNGVITGVTIDNPGNSYSISPFVTVFDPTGQGSGAIVVALRNGTATFADGGIAAAEMEGGLTDDFIASGAKICLFLGATNDLGRGYTQQQTKDAVVAISRKLLSRGVLPIVLAELPRDASNGVSNKTATIVFRRWFTQELPRLAPGVVVVDVWHALTDPNTGNWRTGYTPSGDGLHPAPIGAYLIAKTIWGRISPYFPQGGIYKTTENRTWDQYSASNPRGNLLVQPCMTQGTPQTADSGWTGQKMQNLMLSKVGSTGTGTIAASVVQRTDERAGHVQRLQVDVTGETDGAIYRVRWASSDTVATISVQGGNTLQMGDRIQFILDEVKMSNSVNVKAIRAYMQQLPTTDPTGTKYNIAGFMYDATGNVNFPQLTETLFMPTREMIIGQHGAQVFAVDVVFDIIVGAGAASFTVDIFGASLRRLSP